MKPIAGAVKRILKRLEEKKWNLMFSVRSHIEAPVSSHNALSPARMSADQRLDEVAGILAAGLLRWNERRCEQENSNNNNALGEDPLDFTGHRSGHGLEPERRKP
jgi:hypothetical protein